MISMYFRYIYQKPVSFKFRAEKWLKFEWWIFEEQQEGK